MRYFIAKAAGNDSISIMCDTWEAAKHKLNIGSVSISGPSNICSTTATYSLPVGVTGNWSVTGNLQFGTSNTTNVNSVTVKPLSYSGSSGKLMVSASGKTDTITIQTCDISIYGSNEICYSGTFYVSNSLSATWNVSSGYIVSPSSGNLVAVTATPGNQQNGTVTATINGVPVVKTIQSCGPINGTTEFCGTETYTLNIPGASATSWEVHPDQFFELIFSDSQTAVVNDHATTGNGVVGTLIAMVNGQAYFKTFTVKCRGGSSSYVIAYPNPANDILNIEIDVDAALAQLQLSARTSLTFDIHLYNDQGGLMRQATSKGGVVQFNVANLPDGFYYLHVYDGVSVKPEMLQIIIKH